MNFTYFIFCLKKHKKYTENVAPEATKEQSSEKEHSSKKKQKNIHPKNKHSQKLDWPDPPQSTKNAVHNFKLHTRKIAKKTLPGKMNTLIGGQKHKKH